MKKIFKCVFCCLDWTLGLKFANVQLQWIDISFVLGKAYTF